METSEAPRARKISAAIWESHRHTIQELHQTKPLMGEDGVIAYMMRNYNFAASKSQYETQFKKWGFRKYLKRKELDGILPIVEDRERQGKRTKVRIGGILRSTEQLDRERARHRPFLARRSATNAEESTTSQPLGSIVVYTPPASPNVHDQISLQETIPQALGNSLCSDLATVTSPLQVTHPANQHTFGILSTGHKPFSWMSSLDWKLLKRLTKENQSLMRHFSAKGSIDEALFYPTRQIARFSLEPEVDIVFAKHLLTLVLNDIKHSSQVGLIEVHEWIRQLPHSIILQFFKALPSGQSDIVQERIFASAVQAKDERTVKLILRSGFDLTQKIQIDGGAGSPGLPICKAINSDAYLIARAIAKQLCVSNPPYSYENLGHQLDEVLSSPGSFHCHGPNHACLMDIVQMLLDAGATPASKCLNSAFAIKNPGIIVQLLQQCRDDSMDYIRENVIYYCFSRGDRYCETILSYFLPKEVDRIDKHPITKSILWEALEFALETEDTRAINRILDAASFLDIELGSPDWKTTTCSIFVTACREKNWMLINQLFPLPRIRSKSDLRTPFDDALEAAEQARKTHPSEPVLINHVLVDRIQAHDFSNYGLHNIYNMISRAQASSCDNLVVALFSHLELWNLVSRPMLELLANMKVAAISRIVSKNFDCMAALAAFSDCGDSQPLEDLLFRARPFAKNHALGQVAMRCLAYFAISHRDYSLLKWILQSGLLACAIVVEMEVGILGDPKVVKSLYRSSVYSFDFVICSLFDVAVCQHDIPMIQFFQDQGTESRCSSSLMVAVLAGADETFLESLLLLLQNGKPNYERNYGSSALRAAIFRKNYHLLQYLASRVDVNGIDDLFVQGLEADSISRCCLSPLGDAILRQDYTAAKILIENHADLNGLIVYDIFDDTKVCNKKGSFLSRMSPLLAAVDMEDLDMTRLLVANGAEVDQASRLGLMRSPIQRAAEIGNFKMVQYLLTHGASVDAAPCRNGGTALQLAALQGYVGIASLLIEHGADVNHPPAKGDGRTALEGATEWSRPDMISLLVSKGVDFDLVVDSEGSTQYERALKFALDNGRPASKRFLERIRKESDTAGINF